MKKHLKLLAILSLFSPVPTLAHPGPDAISFDDDALLAAAVSADPVVTIEVRGDYRYFDANGIPNHDTGNFPNRSNPNSISPQRYHLRVPVKPTYNEKATPNKFPNLFGIALNGVPFDPATAEWFRNDPQTGWNLEAINTIVKPIKKNLGIDIANAHVQPTGAYHYHSIPTPLLRKLGGDNYKNKMTLLGFAADGFPIYGPYAYSDPNDPKSPVKEMRSSYKLKDGNRPVDKNSPGGKYDGTYTWDWKYVKDSGDLDESNGRTGVTPEYPAGTYYYALTDAFPYIPRSFHGTPDQSFERGPRRGGQGQRQGPPQRGARN